MAPGKEPEEDLFGRPFPLTVGEADSHAECVVTLCQSDQVHRKEPEELPDVGSYGLRRLGRPPGKMAVSARTGQNAG